MDFNAEHYFRASVERMKLDPVLAEIRAAREAYAEKFAGDIKAMLADIRQRQLQSGRKVVSLPPKRIAVSQRCATQGVTDGHG